MNQGFGFSLNVDGCLVTDAGFLLNYLGAGAISTAAAIDLPTGRMMPTTVTFYESEKQAGDRFESAFAAPVVLQRFVDRISWTTTSPFPSADGNEVQLAAPQLGDLFGDERLHAEMMTHTISSS